MTLSVGTIETYVPGSTEFYETQYGNLGAEDQTPLTLSDSNLWLVDTTTLDPDGTEDLSLLLLNPDGSTTEGYLAPMGSTTLGSTTGDITIYGSTPTTDSVLYTNSSALQLSDGSSLLEVQGGTQSSATLSADGSSNLGSATLTGIGTTSGADTTLSGTGSTGSLTLPSTGDGDGSGTPTTGGLDGNPDTPIEVQPVPFDLHTSLGLIILGAVVVVRRRGWWQRRSMAQS